MLSFVSIAVFSVISIIKSERYCSNSDVVCVGGSYGNDFQDILLSNASPGSGVKFVYLLEDIILGTSGVDLQNLESGTKIDPIVIMPHPDFHSKRLSLTCAFDYCINFGSSWWKLTSTNQTRLYITSSLSHDWILSRTDTCLLQIDESSGGKTIIKDVDLGTAFNTYINIYCGEHSKCTDTLFDGIVIEDVRILECVHDRNGIVSTAIEYYVMANSTTTKLQVINLMIDTSKYYTTPELFFTRFGPGVVFQDMAIPITFEHVGFNFNLQYYFDITFRNLIFDVGGLSSLAGFGTSFINCVFSTDAQAEIHASYLVFENVHFAVDPKHNVRFLKSNGRSGDYGANFIFRNSTFKNFKNSWGECHSIVWENSSFTRNAECALSLPEICKSNFNVSICDSSLCKNGANCSETPCHPQNCKCLDNWYGSLCDLCPKNYDVDCRNCRNKWHGFECGECPVEYNVSSDCSECVIWKTGVNCTEDSGEPHACNGVDERCIDGIRFHSFQDALDSFDSNVRKLYIGVETLVIPRFYFSDFKGTENDPIVITPSPYLDPSVNEVVIQCLSFYEDHDGCLNFVEPYWIIKSSENVKIVISTTNKYGVMIREESRGKIRVEGIEFYIGYYMEAVKVQCTTDCDDFGGTVISNCVLESWYEYGDTGGPKMLRVSINSDDTSFERVVSKGWRYQGLGYFRAFRATNEHDYDLNVAGCPNCTFDSNILSGSGNFRSSSVCDVSAFGISNYGIYRILNLDYHDSIPGNTNKGCIVDVTDFGSWKNGNTFELHFDYLRVGWKPEITSKNYIVKTDSGVPSVGTTHYVFKNVYAVNAAIKIVFCDSIEWDVENNEFVYTYPGICQIDIDPTCFNITALSDKNYCQNGGILFCYPNNCLCPNKWTSRNCSLCPAYADKLADCTCPNNWIDGDFGQCEVCPNNFNLSNDCSGCVGGWTEASNCTICDDHWEESSNCQVCSGLYFGDLCDQCPENANENCTECENGWVGLTCDFCSVPSSLPNCSSSCPGFFTGDACGDCDFNLFNGTCVACKNDLHDDAYFCSKCLDKKTEYPNCTNCLNDPFFRKDMSCECTDYWQGSDCSYCDNLLNQTTCDKCKSSLHDSDSMCTTCVDDPLRRKNYPACTHCEKHWSVESGCTECPPEIEQRQCNSCVSDVHDIDEGCLKCLTPENSYPDCIDETSADTEEETIADTLEETIADTLEETIADTLEETIADTLEETIADTEEETIADTLEVIIADTEEETIADTLEETIVDTLEETIADTEEETIADTLEETLFDTIADTDEETNAETLEETLRDTLDETLGETDEETLSDNNGETTSDTLEETLADTIEETLADTIEETLADTDEEIIVETVEETIADTNEETLAETVEDSIAETNEETLTETSADTNEETFSDTHSETVEVTAETIEDTTYLIQPTETDEDTTSSNGGGGLLTGMIIAGVVAGAGAVLVVVIIVAVVIVLVVKTNPLGENESNTQRKVNIEYGDIQLEEKTRKNNETSKTQRKMLN